MLTATPYPREPLLPFAPPPAPSVPRSLCAALGSMTKPEVAQPSPFSVSREAPFLPIAFQNPSAFPPLESSSGRGPLPAIVLGLPRPHQNPNLAPLSLVLFSAPSVPCPPSSVILNPRAKSGGMRQPVPLCLILCHPEPLHPLPYFAVFPFPGYPCPLPFSGARQRLVRDPPPRNWPMDD
jgi:hypothetical protein